MNTDERVHVGPESLTPSVLDMTERVLYVASVTSAAGAPSLLSAREAVRAVLNVAGIGLYVAALVATSSTWLLVGAALVGSGLSAVPGQAKTDPAVEASSLTRSVWGRVLTNFATTGLFFIGIALAIHSPSPLSVARKVVIGTAFGLPALAMLLGASRGVRSVLVSPRTEFEGDLLRRTAAVSFAVVARLTIGYSVGQIFGAPRLEGWWVLVCIAVVWSAVNNLIRRQMTG